VARPGRRYKFDEPASAAIRIRVTSAQRQALERVARDNNMDVTSVIREAVNEWVADYLESPRGVFRGTQSTA
jgi:hypothetical protein